MLKIKKKIVILLTFIMLLSINLFNNKTIFSESKSNVNIHFNTSELENIIKEDTQVYIWKLPNENLTKDELVKKLNKIDIDEIISKYGEPFVKLDVLKNKKVELKDLATGMYYVREYQKDITRKMIAPFIFEITGKETDPTDIYPKIWDKIKKNILKKISEKGEPLEGATFKITKKIGESYIPIIKDGKEYIVKSDSNGYFSLTGLEDDTYYLWEVKAPEGYKALSDNVEFKVKGDVISNDIILIKNKPFKPGIEIPNTGDIIFFVMIFGGLILFIAGYYMTRDKSGDR